MEPLSENSTRKEDCVVLLLIGVYSLVVVPPVKSVLARLAKSTAGHIKDGLKGGT
jgi:hypothetical protein